jgi:hypothetical protein
VPPTAVKQSVIASEHIVPVIPHEPLMPADHVVDDQGTNGRTDEGCAGSRIGTKPLHQGLHPSIEPDPPRIRRPRHRASIAPIYARRDVQVERALGSL